MTIKNGGPGAMRGVIFRHKLGAGNNYIFFLGTDGSYEIDINTNNSRNALRSDKIPDFTIGLNHLHTIGIVANGTQISVYVDQKQIIQMSDSTYISGEIGMVSKCGTSNTTVAYINAKVWQL